jgi:hypothetical protein
MEVEEKDVDRLVQFLFKKFRAGDKWGAFDDCIPTAGVNDITTFKHIAPANKYCKEYSGYMYGTSEHYSYYDCNFKPILNLIKSLSGDGSEPKSTRNLDRLAEQIQEHSLIAASSTFYHRAIFDLLADGMYHPVGVKQQIHPWKDIENYEVIADFLPERGIYEIELTHGRMGVFGNYYQAQKCFE